MLGAIATKTTRIKIGPMVTALPRHRPWKVARETVTLDHLSSGRVILGVGSGWPPDGDFETFGEDPDLGVRAQKLDEGLAIVQGLWSASAFSFAGRHYSVAETTFLPGPVQKPRIPIWVAATWPARGPLARAARWDGVVPLNVTPEPALPLDIVTALLGQLQGRINDAFDVVIAGTSPLDSVAAAQTVQPFGDAGATWWLETVDGQPGWHLALRERVLAGPPVA